MISDRITALGHIKVNTRNCHTHMDHLGQKRKAAPQAADDEATEAANQRKYRTQHSKLLLREVEGTGATWVQRMSSEQRMQWIERFILKPILEDDLPGLLDVGEEQEMKYILVRLKPSSSAQFWPYIRISWNSDCFRAAGNLKDDFETTFTELLGHKHSMTTRSTNDLRTNPILAVHGISTIDDLISLAPAMRTMASVVFRDAWLIHLLKKEKSWFVQNYTIALHHGNNSRILRMSMEICSISRRHHAAVNLAVHPSYGTHRQGLILIVPQINAYCSWEFWKPRLKQIHWNPMLDEINIKYYDTHADASRVIDVLRVLLPS